MERRWNVASNQVYIRSMNEGVPTRETESLATKDRINEAIMISLRTMEGLDLKRIEKEFGAGEQQRLQKAMQHFVQQDLIRQKETIYQLTNEGMLRADGIAAALFH
jgi:oxygen-independent coproporphyrinogen-3 oxidase